jgi:Predicted signal transduction protein with a C-terminal ATPase domain
MNLPLKVKISIINIVIIVCSITFLGIYFYNAYYQNVISEVGNSQSQNTEFIKNDIGLIENNIKILSTNLLINDSFQSMLKLPPNRLSSVDRNEAIDLELDALVSSNYISYISVYANNGFNFYYSKNGSCTGRPYGQVSKLSYVRKALSLRGKPYWITLADGGKGILVNNNSGSTLTMVQGIINTDTCELSGLLIVCIDWDTIWSYVPKSDANVYFAADKSGSIVSFAGKPAKFRKSGESLRRLFGGAALPKNQSMTTVGGQSYLYTECETDGGDYRIVNLLPLDLALQGIRSAMPMFLFVIIICIIFSFVVSLFTSALVTNPIKKLVETINNTKRGDLKAKVSLHYRDEIGMLGNEYNNMLDELNSLFSKVLQLELRNKEAQIKAMQEQINPHFLYNTLDSIYIKAIRFKDYETAKMIYALSQIFRLTLNSGREFIQVGDEIRLIENYLALQKIRFKDKVTYSISVDPEIMDMEIPKLILQPFVENSIVHGMGIMAEPVNIRIEGRLVRDTISFTLQDDGVGIPPDKIERIHDAARNGEDEENLNGTRKGIAISNVIKRLSLYYGEKHSLRISSAQGKGTLVTILITPKVSPKVLLSK